MPRGDSSNALMVVIPFGPKGLTCNPRAVAGLEAMVRDGGYTDVYVLCPGWHDGWQSAIGWMDAFAAGYERARTWAGDATTRPAAYKPLYVGVVWPGEVFNRAYPAFGSEARRSPMRPDVDRSAMLSVLTTDPSEESVQRLIQALRDRGHDLRATRLEKMLASPLGPTPPEQIDLADCLLPLFGPEDEPSVPGLRYAVTAGSPPVRRTVEASRFGLIGISATPLPPMSAIELLEVWKDALRTVAVTVKRPTTDGTAAKDNAAEYGLNVLELRRWAIRSADLRVINDRAYRLGRSGLRDLMDRVRLTNGPRVHVVAHSFGAGAALAALTPAADEAAGTPERASAPSATWPSTAPAVSPDAVVGPAPRLVDSLLLLSPLVNHWAMGGAPPIDSAVPPKLQSAAAPGAFHSIATGRMVRSVVVVYSSRDWFATSYAPLATRRPTFEGMASADSWSGPGNGFATMGGVGPNGIDPPPYREGLIAPGAGPQATLRYNFPGSSATVVAIDASASLTNHGEANDRTIWWLFANQVEASRSPRLGAQTPPGVNPRAQVSP
ncbi:hypothetical protein [Humisphaera borealis]|uniref:Alpha/beta hydrolase n=1 Tax=Humisphaera borealis TaxID=2807512 RepID=A0A7M2WZE1_9BACT|nr:hypothetical protein [Humisphaera borealis]QOV90562.1 hypothetical protein IPV69_04120 [Humisphaera borealis]